MSFEERTDAAVEITSADYGAKVVLVEPKQNLVDSLQALGRKVLDHEFLSMGWARWQRQFPRLLIALDSDINVDHFIEQASDGDSRGAPCAWDGLEHFGYWQTSKEPGKHPGVLARIFRITVNEPWQLVFHDPTTAPFVEDSSGSTLLGLAVFSRGTLSGR
ncbi:uncharacterized protein BO97DRAFT_425467 [Aspergillus homomorphus CBS 101889]|uniref:Uncharacterized protein n=1 Tax=Aspergillus homomorphus (strain CBS 101889) TaxID=1450537 RepID=A0A395HUJ3_ASPHC|nr:hypothetical protein BO97DRAFT_425467 [Aspergillus homomorphus CBS 101889]RAL11470.1 hypothetical protein BO97DRAFT_425467 [Aspergillus homomorphus CBS 101889]